MNCTVLWDAALNELLHLSLLKVLWDQHHVQTSIAVLSTR
jgi:hypothetical protein